MLAKRTAFGLLLLLSSSLATAQLRVSNRAPDEDGIGYLPAESQPVAVNPPPMTWLAEPDATTYTLEISPTPDFARPSVRAATKYLMHTHSAPLALGRHWWRYAYQTAAGASSDWSRARSFEVPAGVPEFPRVATSAALAAIPATHPRAFVRPEDVPALRAAGPGIRREYDQLTSAALAALAIPVMQEPKPWTNGEWNMREWSKYYGEMTTASRAIEALGFAYLVTRDKRFGEGARQRLLEWTRWDPRGPSSVKVNDEQTMPIIYSGARVYSWINDLLAEPEREAVRAMMLARCADVYRHLRRAPYEQFPYDSHSGRLWHILGEAAMIFHGEIPEADEWLDYALTIFHGWYPVWGDPDGGWAEGVHYWASYNEFVTTWLEEMRAILRVDGTAKPFYAHVGDFPMFVCPPGAAVCGFGDFSEGRGPGQRGRVAGAFAAARGNPHWQWYADRTSKEGYSGPLSYLRALRERPAPSPPETTTPLRVFPRAGWALFNSALADPTRNVQLALRSSPYGNVSHSHSDQNNIVLGAFGSPLLVNTGRRDFYGSPFCHAWYWASVGHNCVLLGGAGQGRGVNTKGAISAHGGGSDWAYAVGDAAAAYGPNAKLVRRWAAFVRGETVVLVDEVQASTSSVDLMFHGRAPFVVDEKSQVFRLANGEAALDARIFARRPVRLSQTDQYPVQPDPTTTCGPEWHLRARLDKPSPDKPETIVTVMEIRRAGDGARNRGASVRTTPDAIAVSWRRDGRQQQLRLNRRTLRAAFNETQTR
jgi:hypothetical protein